MKGRIVTITEHGFFFIKGEDERQYFAHRSKLIVRRHIYDIRLDDEVLFEPGEGEKGPRAESVVVCRLDGP
jgi:cold shock CspA family protein